MASALGVAQRALDLAVDYAQQRVTFGKPIASRQAIKFKLADMEIRLQTARAQLFYNAQLIDKGIYDGMLGSVTKTCVSEWYLMLQIRHCRFLVVMVIAENIR